MLALINTNRMQPPIAPIGLAYVAAAARQAGIDVEVLDPCLSDDAEAAIDSFFRHRQPALVGMSFRNLDDSFWPSARWFADDLVRQVAAVRSRTDAPVVLGGVGFSICPGKILAYSGADFGIHGDGERAIVELYRQLAGRRRLQEVPGLIWRGDAPQAAVVANRPAWCETVSVPTRRDVLDNAEYFRLGGQGGIETKRGCPRKCIYCADPLAKGPGVRMRPPGEVADEVAALLGQGVDVLHFCDGEFNIPRSHALAVCEELIARGLGRRVRWYAYLAVTPLDTDLAEAMRKAGCVGADFTADAGCDAMLAGYAHPHRGLDLARAARICRDSGITCMMDLLLGGPGETPQTLAETIEFMKRIGPDCIGAGVGMRIYAGTPVEAVLRAAGPLETNAGIRRHYEGPVDLFRPTYYVSEALGDSPAALVGDLIGDDGRFFPPADEHDLAAGHNYNDNAPLVEAIAAGARGAYWDILRNIARR